MLTALIIFLVVAAGIVVTVLTVALATVRQYTCAPMVRYADPEAEEKHPQ
jgi:hypothetical protein